MQEELGPQEAQNIPEQPLSEGLTAPVPESGIIQETPPADDTEVMNQAAASAKAIVDEGGKKGFSTSVKLTAGAAGLAAAVGGGLAYNSTQHNSPEHSASVITTTPAPSEAASARPTEIPLATPTDTSVSTPEATHTVVIKPPVSPHPATTEQTHNTSPSASKTPETQHTNFEAQLEHYAQAIGTNGEALSNAKDWTKSVSGNMETFTRPASVEGNDTVNGEYKLLLVHDNAGRITEARWQTLAVSKDQQRTQVLDSFDLANDNGWVGSVTHYTGSGSDVKTYKGSQWNNNTVQTFEEKMDNVGNNATTNPPKPLVYPS